MVIDHSASPGIPELGLPAGVLLERKTYTCAHCQGTVVINEQRTRPHEWCEKCDKYICASCKYLLEKTGQCRSSERLFDALQNALERGDMVSSTGLILSQI